MKFNIVITIILMLNPLSAFAYQQEIDKFFHLYEKGEVTKAVDSIYATNKWIKNKADDVEQIKSQLQNLKNLVGEYHSKVELGSETLKERLVYVSYLTLFERQPVRLEFVFYRPQEDWVIYSFSFDDTIDDELEAFARKKIISSNKKNK